MIYCSSASFSLSLPLSIALSSHLFVLWWSRGDSCALPWNLINRWARTLGVTCSKEKLKAIGTLTAWWDQTAGTCRTFGGEQRFFSLQLFSWMSSISFSMNDTNDKNGVLVYEKCNVTLVLVWWVQPLQTECAVDIVRVCGGEKTLDIRLGEDSWSHCHMHVGLPLLCHTNSP